MAAPESPVCYVNVARQLLAPPHEANGLGRRGRSRQRKTGDQRICESSKQAGYWFVFENFVGDYFEHFVSKTSVNECFQVEESIVCGIPPDWWGHKFGFVSGGLLGAGSRKKRVCISKNSNGIERTAFHEDDQEKLYKLVQDKSTTGKQGLGIRDRPKKVVGCYFEGKKTTFNDSDDEDSAGIGSQEKQSGDVIKEEKTDGHIVEEETLGGILLGHIVIDHKYVFMYIG